MNERGGWETQGEMGQARRCVRAAPPPFAGCSTGHTLAPAFSRPAWGNVANGENMPAEQQSHTDDTTDLCRLGAKGWSRCPATPNE